MVNFWSQLKYELRYLLVLPSTYITSCLFLLLMGTVYFMILYSYSEVPQQGLPSEDLFASFWLPLFFMVPLITMRSFAEERRMGTLETLFSTQISPFALTMSKYVTAYVFYMGLWGLTLNFPLLVAWLVPSANLNNQILHVPTFLGGFSFIALSGVFYVSIGIFFSSITRSQITAAIFTFFTLFLLLVSSKFIPELLQNKEELLSWVSFILDHNLTFNHLESFSHGVVDSRPLTLYVSGAVLMLTLTIARLRI